MSQNYPLTIFHQAVLEREKRRSLDEATILKWLMEDLLQHNDNYKIKWNDLSAPLRCALHDLLNKGWIEINCQETGPYASEYFIKLTDEGLSEILIKAI